MSDNWDQYKDLAYREMLAYKVALRYSDIKNHIKIYGRNGMISK